EVVVVRGVVSGVQEHGTEDGLERVGQQRLQAPAAALGDAFAQVEVAAEIKLLRQLGQGVRVDHRGAGLGQLALGRAGVMLVEILGGDQLEDGVAEILEPLVVARRDGWTFIRKRAVGDRFEQEPWVAKVNPDLLLEKLQGLRQRCAASARVLFCLGLCYEPAFSWMYSHACPTVVIFSASSSGISRPVFSSNA